MSRVLVTGATGFIGRHVVALLEAQGHEVHAVTRRRTEEESPTAAADGEGGAALTRGGVVWHEADLLRPDAASTLVGETQPERLLHLAWCVVPEKFWSAPENERWIDASLRLLRAFGEAGGARAVMAGTCAEYEWGEELLREGGTPLLPATLYGACKHATHVAASASARELGVSFAWARIFFLYGPGEPAGRLVSTVASELLAGKEVPTSDGFQRRDFMHVRDVAGAVAALLASDVEGAVNVATGAAVPVRDVVALIAEATDGRAQVRVGELPARTAEPPVIVGDARRLTEEVGFRARVTLGEGIAETVEWWRERTPGVRGSGK
jgi:nucleoside-diphosphate-sugar epimerase